MEGENNWGNVPEGEPASETRPEVAPDAATSVETETRKQLRRDALIDAKKVGNEALKAGEAPLSAMTAFLMVLQEREVLHTTDTTLALCVAEAGAKREDVEKFINGYRTE